jgi:hypothetical protein
MVLPDIHPKRDIIGITVNSEENSFLSPGRGFKNAADFYRRLDLLTDYDGEWKRAYAGPKERLSWMPQSVPFEYKDTLAVMKDLLMDTRMSVVYDI